MNDEALQGLSSRLQLRNDRVALAFDRRQGVRIGDADVDRQLSTGHFEPHGDGAEVGGLKVQAQFLDRNRGDPAVRFALRLAERLRLVGQSSAEIG